MGRLVIDSTPLVPELAMNPGQNGDYDIICSGTLNGGFVIGSRDSIGEVDPTKTLANVSDNRLTRTDEYQLRVYDSTTDYSWLNAFKVPTQELDSLQEKLDQIDDYQTLAIQKIDAYDDASCANQRRNNLLNSGRGYTSSPIMVPATSSVVGDVRTAEGWKDEGYYFPDYRLYDIDVSLGKKGMLYDTYWTKSATNTYELVWFGNNVSGLADKKWIPAVGTILGFHVGDDDNPKFAPLPESWVAERVRNIIKSEVKTALMLAKIQTFERYGEERSNNNEGDSRSSLISDLKTTYDMTDVEIETEITSLYDVTTSVSKPSNWSISPTNAEIKGWRGQYRFINNLYYIDPWVNQTVVTSNSALGRALQYASPQKRWNAFKKGLSAKGWTDFEGKTIKIRKITSKKIDDTTVPICGSGGTMLGPVDTIDGEWCFLQDTPVQLSDGTDMPICEVKPGMKVFAFDALNKRTTAIVQHNLSRTVESYLTIETTNRSVGVTEEHPFYIGDGDFKLARELCIGDDVQVLQDNVLVSETITKVSHNTDAVRVYNLSVNGTHTFFAQGFAVHNKSLTEKEYEFDDYIYHGRKEIIEFRTKVGAPIIGEELENWIHIVPPPVETSWLEDLEDAADEAGEIIEEGADIVGDVFDGIGEILGAIDDATPDISPGQWFNLCSNCVCHDGSGCCLCDNCNCSFWG
jgi:hypothetical protein